MKSLILMILTMSKSQDLNKLRSNQHDDFQKCQTQFIKNFHYLMIKSMYLWEKRLSWLTSQRAYQINYQTPPCLKYLQNLNKEGSQSSQTVMKGLIRSCVNYQFQSQRGKWKWLLKNLNIVLNDLTILLKNQMKL